VTLETGEKNEKNIVPVFGARVVVTVARSITSTTEVDWLNLAVRFAVVTTLDDRSESDRVPLVNELALVVAGVGVAGAHAVPFHVATWPLVADD
jgi:hypothetical protein